MSHVRRSDWAATVPWAGILDKPASLGGDTDIGELKGAGFSIGDIPQWDGSKFIPGTSGSGSAGTIANLDSPGVATKRVNPDSGQIEQVWLREVFDVRQYGADNTGGTDATASFNSAISALNANGGGALIVPAGRYTVAGTLNRILGRCWVHGDGQGSTIINLSADGWWVTSGSFFGCTGMTLNGSSAVATGIKLMDTASHDNFLLTDLRISGFGYSISVDTVLRAGWIERVRLDALELALSLKASDSFVRGISIYNGGDTTKNAFEMTGYRNQVSDFKLLGDDAHFKKGLFVNDGGNHIISGGMIIGCEEEAISLSNGTGGVSGCRVQNISWQTIGTDPDVVSYDPATNYVNDLYEIGTGTPVTDNVVLVAAPATAADPGANNQVANDGAYFYSYKDTGWLRTPLSSWVTTSAEPELGIWQAGVVAAGGTFAADSVSIAQALVIELKGKSYYDKILYLLPLLGSNLAAARMPLIDVLAVGIATNNNFVNGDFDQAFGLQGNGSTKYLNSLIRPSQLGVSGNGGIGYIENNYPVSPVGTDMIGCYDNSGTYRFTLDVRPTVRIFFWGTGGTNAGELAAAVNGDYYGNRSSATSRKLFLNGSIHGTNTTSDIPSGMADRTMLILGGDESGTINYWAGRCAGAYMTDGTMSDADVADLYATLQSFLITPTGRP